MTHRYFIIICLLTLTRLLGCNRDEYHPVGSFVDRITAENVALTYLLNNYEDLPSATFRKVVYRYSRNGIEQRNAIWYNKGSGQLAVETDVNSGYCCSWQGVDRTKLSQLAKIKKGVFQADFLVEVDVAGYRGDIYTKSEF